MDELIQKLKTLIAAAFPESELWLGRPRKSTRVGGTLVWEGFAGLDQIDRQRQLRAALEQGLTADELLGVSLILTLTPAEQAVMRAS